MNLNDAIEAAKGGRHMTCPSLAKTGQALAVKPGTQDLIFVDVESKAFRGAGFSEAMSSDDWSELSHQEPAGLPEVPMRQAGELEASSSEG